jgi:hypothetical protein
VAALTHPASTAPLGPAMTNLQRFEREIIHANGLRLPLVLGADTIRIDPDARRPGDA